MWFTLMVSEGGSTSHVNDWSGIISDFAAPEELVPLLRFELAFQGVTDRK